MTSPATTDTVAPTVSVVICAYTLRRWEQLEAAVASVRAQSRPAQVIVVIDHSPALLSRAGGLDAVVVPNTDAQGLSGARNTGVRLATEEIVAFLDDDAAAAPSWLTRLTASYADPHVLGVGGYVRPAWAGPRPAWFPDEFDWVVGCSYRGLPTERQPVRNFIGANMSFRRRVFEDVGCFATGVGRSSTAPLGCEETEFAIRVRQRFPDAIMVYDPAAVVDHSVGVERTTWRYFVRRCFAEGLSKALVARSVGGSDATSNERAYVIGALRRGVGREVRRALRGHPDSAVQALAIVAGLGVTAGGYGLGRVGLGGLAVHAVDRPGRPAVAVPA